MYPRWFKISFGGLADQNGNLILFFGENLIAKIPIIGVVVDNKVVNLKTGFLWITSQRVVILGTEKKEAVVYVSLNPLKMLMGSLIFTAINKLKEGEVALPFTYSDLMGVLFGKFKNLNTVRFVIKDPKTPSKSKMIDVIPPQSYVEYSVKIIAQQIQNTTQGFSPHPTLQKTETRPNISLEVIESKINELKLRLELGEYSKEDYEKAIKKFEEEIGLPGIVKKLEELKLRYNLGELTTDEYKKLKHKLLMGY